MRAAPLLNALQTTNKVILPIRPITSVSTVVAVDATGKEPQRRPSRRDSGSRSLADLPLGLKNVAVRQWCMVVVLTHSWDESARTYEL